MVEDHRQGLRVSFEGGYVNVDAKGGKSVSGFDNLEITPIVELARERRHMNSSPPAPSAWEVGGSGPRISAIGNRASRPPSCSAKGMGDLPDSMALLRPLAVTGRAGYVIPGTTGDPHVLEWSFAVEYSLRYLTDNVRDVGLGPFWSHVTPVVEFALIRRSTAMAAAPRARSIRVLLWSGQTMQLGVEAILPVNDHTGSNVGVTVQLHFYIDDMFPHSLGTPLYRRCSIETLAPILFAAWFRHTGAGACVSGIRRPRMPATTLAMPPPAPFTWNSARRWKAASAASA